MPRICAVHDLSEKYTSAIRANITARWHPALFSKDRAALDATSAAARGHLGPESRMRQGGPPGMIVVVVLELLYA
jgi:hypothetical protein